MKISKVKHTRMAVSRRLTDNNEEIAAKRAAVEGILYKNPSEKKNAGADLEKHIDDLNKDAQKLYNVLNTNTKGGSRGNQSMSYDDKKLIKNMAKNFNTITRWLLKKTNYVSEEKAIQKQLNGLKNFPTERIPVKWDKKEGQMITKFGREFKIFLSGDFTDEDLKQTVEKIIKDRLKNSLRKYITAPETNERIYIPDVLGQLMYAFCLGNEYKNAYHQIPQNHIVLTLQVMNADYTKKEMIAKTIKSVKNQNVKVQPDRDGVLKLSGADHVDPKKDYKSKRYIFDFIKEYACLDEDARKKKLRHMRMLILLYFYGEEMYLNPSNGITAYSFGSSFALDEEVFSKEAWEILDVGEEKCPNKRDQAKVKEYVRKELSARFHKFFVEKKVDLADSDYFWLNWMIGEVEGTLYKSCNGKTNRERQKRLTLVYLCKRVWNHWIAFIAMKYVDIGKAVHHFATPEMSAMQNGGEIAFGKLLPQYEDGLTSFDYERITAEDSLERGLSTYVTFAVNTFAQASISEEGRNKNGKEDVLCDKEAFNKDGYKDSMRRILQYFGGKSKWDESDIVHQKPADLWETMRQALYFVRNEIIHYYTPENDTNAKMNVELLRQMYDKEVSGMRNLYIEKFCSNNVMWYYSPDDVISFMNHLYHKSGAICRMPAFKNVIGRKKMREVLRELVDKGYYNKNIISMEPGDLNKLESALYFLLSEIYYQDFIAASDELLMDLFCDAVEKLDIKDRKNGNNGRAAEDFQKRVDKITDTYDHCTLEMLCELIMTDYNMQNTEKEKLASKDTGKDKDKRIYQHFPILLRQCMGRAFLEYVKSQDGYTMLKQPRLRGENTIEAAENKLREKGSELEIAVYRNEELRQDDRLMAWYAVAHFLSPKYLNQLNGSLLSYVQLVNNINRRAEMTGNRTVDNHIKTDYYRNVVWILGLVRNYAGRISANITDYFDGDKKEAEEGYAKYLSNYLAFCEEGREPSATVLREFAMQKIDKGSPSGYVGIYYDGDNPILNRNIILTMLYGDIKSVREKVDKLTLQEIRKFYSDQNRLKAVLESGICQNEKQQREYKWYQLQKNRIELVDVRIFSEIINDLHAKLISWSYLRERDLLYFQLGVHYLRMQYSKDIGEKDFQRVIYSDNIRITEGAVLYQILAMNTYHLPLYEEQDVGKAVAVDKNANIGKKVGSFLKIYDAKKYGEGIYEVALELFEHKVEHQDIIYERNYFDHFKYYVKADQSIMDMYGEVYDRFFTYDLKLQKSVTYILADILKSYFVIPDIRMSGEKIISNKSKEKYTRRTRYPEISGRLDADEMTYKVEETDKRTGDKKKVQVCARTDKFLEQLKDILEYKR